MSTKFKWRASIGLIAAWVAIVKDIPWIWGIIFLVWVIQEIKEKQAHFLEFVDRKHNPILYWAIIVSWIFMSLYLLITPFVPKLNPDSEEFVGYRKPVNYTAVMSGFYQPNLIGDQKAKLIQLEDVKKSDSARSVKKTEELKNDDVLRYQNFASPEIKIIGLSIETTFINSQHNKDIKALWDKFMALDADELIPSLEAPEIYAVYSNYKGVAKSNFTYSIGLRYNGKEVKNKDLKLLTIPKTNFAVFNTYYDDEKSINKTWLKIQESDLKRAFSYDIELFKIDPHSFDIKDVEIWTATKLTQDEKQ